VALIVNNLPFGGAVSALVSAALPGVPVPSELDDITAAVPTVQTLAISTYNTGAPLNIEEGFTVIVPIKITGDFANTLSAIFPDPSTIRPALKLRISQSGFVVALTV